MAASDMDFRLHSSFNFLYDLPGCPTFLGFFFTFDLPFSSSILQATHHIVCMEASQDSFGGTCRCFSFCGHHLVNLADTLSTQLGLTFVGSFFLLFRLFGAQHLRLYRPKGSHSCFLALRRMFLVHLDCHLHDIWVVLLVPNWAL